MYQKSRSYDVCFLIYGCDRHNFLSFWDIFCPLAPGLTLKIKIWKTFDPPNNPKNQNFGKMKKMFEDIILFLCITNDDHMMYSSWDMECDRIFVTLSHLSFYYNNNLKNQNFEKMKETMEITSFYTCVPQMTIIWCMVSEKWSVTEFFLVLDYFLPFYPLTTQKIKILKK